MKEFECPLCGSRRAVEIRRHKAKELIDNYKEKFNVDVTRFFPEKEFSTLMCVDCALRTHYPAIPGDSQFYNEMQLHPFYYESDKPEFSYALNKISETQPDSILEIGCGEGLFLRKLASAYNVAAIEHSSKSIEKLKKSGIKIDTTDRKYDFVMSFQVLEHVSDVRGFLDNAINRLNERGFLLITVPNNDSKYIQEGTSTILDYPPHHLTQWPKKTLEGLAKRFGMEILEYYEEPMRIEHLLGLLSARRNKPPSTSIAAKITYKLGRIIDRIVAPYYIDQVGYGGLTHGILLGKGGKV